jgi:hypothetical protein
MDIRGQLVRGPLKDVSIAYRSEEFIGDRIFPIIDTDDPKMNIYEYLRGDWLRDEAQIRGPSARAPRSTFKLNPIPYNTKEYAFASEVTVEDRKLAKSRMAPPVQPDQDAVELCANKIDRSKERRIAALIKATSWCAIGAAGEDAAGLWAPPGSTNTFILDVETRIETIRAYTGVKPNVLMIDAGTWSKIKQIDAVLDRIKYTGSGADPAKVTPQMIAALFGLDEILIGGALYSSAKETKAGTELTLLNIWDYNASHGMAFLFYRPRTIGLKVPMPGVQVRLRYGEDGGGGIRRTTTWPEPAEHQDVYEVAEETDIVATGTYLGFKWSDPLED